METFKNCFDDYFFMVSTLATEFNTRKKAKELKLSLGLARC